MCSPLAQTHGLKRDTSPVRRMAVIRSSHLSGAVQQSGRATYGGYRTVGSALPGPARFIVSLSQGCQRTSRTGENTHHKREPGRAIQESRHIWRAWANGKADAQSG